MVKPKRKDPSLPARVPAWLPDGVKLRRKYPHSTLSVASQGNVPLISMVWDERGEIFHENVLDTRGRHHGLELERDDDGRIHWVAEWVRDKQHGLAMQLDDRGRPAMITEFVRGTGFDIWLATCNGKGFSVGEVHQHQGGRMRGFVRWGDPRRPWSEEYYGDRGRHGVWRQWKAGKLEAGYPKFFVADEPVSLEAYQAASAQDRTLAPYDPRDNLPRRPMLPAVRDALVRAQQVRRVLTARKRRLAKQPGSKPSADERAYRRELALLDQLAHYEPLRPFAAAAKQPAARKPAKPVKRSPKRLTRRG